MPQPTKEQSYELALSSTLITNSAIIGVVFVLFPFLRRFFPHIFASNQHLEHKNTGLFGYIFWFIDVFKQPLSIFATRGNLATIFAVFQIMLLNLYFVITLISLTILIPVYFYGTDQSWNVNYLTTWSKITLPHLDSGSIMNLIPIFTVIVVTVATMFFYNQFTLIYVFFRQRCLHRMIPQNYVVLLQNIPLEIDSVEELEKVLQPIRNGIKQIVPVPKSASKLYSLFTDIQSTEETLDQLHFDVTELREIQMKDEALAAEFKRQVDITDNNSERQKLSSKLQSKLLETEGRKKRILAKMQQFGDKVKVYRKCRLQILEICYKDNIDVDHLYRVKSLPPELPDVIKEAFDYFPNRRQKMPTTRYMESEVVVKLTQDRKDKIIFQNFEMTTPKNPKHSIGASAFLVCDSQTVASEKYTALITQNQTQPLASLAPSPAEIIWKNVSIERKTQIFRQVLFYILILGLFLAYIWGQTRIYGLIYSAQDVWKVSFFDAFKFGRDCVLEATNTGWCAAAESLASMLVTLIPTVIFCLLMSLLPLFLTFIIRLRSYPSISHSKDTFYNLLFVFLILINGIVQIAIPNLIDVKTGQFNLIWIKDYSITTFIEALGRNVCQTQFTFINYIINKYFTFPVFDLMNFFNIFVGLYVWIAGKDSIAYSRLLRQNSFNYHKQMAYTAHMFVVGFVFTIVAPVTNVIVFVTYLMMIAIDRYFILYVYNPDITADLSPQSNLLVRVITTIFTGLIFMLASTACYFYVRGNDICIFGYSVCIACFLGALYYKILTDQKYKRALQELARGNFQETDKLSLNPARVECLFDDDHDALSRYNIASSNEALQLNRHLGMPDDHVYKMSSRDKLLESIYIDLTKLPVSQVRDDGKDDFTCRVLSQHRQVLVQPLPSEDEKLHASIAANYTHPAILRAIIQDGKK